MERGKIAHTFTSTVEFQYLSGLHSENFGVGGGSRDVEVRGKQGELVSSPIDSRVLGT